jgi:amidase
VTTRTLADLAAFNLREPRETPLFGQEVFEQAQGAPPVSDPGYLAIRAKARDLARGALDRMLRQADVEALVGPTSAPASIVDPVNGSRTLGSYSLLPAVSGYPHLTVPMGQVAGLPVNVSFIGPAWSEERLLGLGFAFEQAARARIDPQFLPDIAARAEFAGAYDPR